MGLAEAIRLEGKVAVVTGGSSGIGRAVALACADEGADVVVAARRAERCAEVAAEAAARGVRAVGVECDVTSDDHLDRLFARVAAELGGADVFVHAAGVSSPRAASEVGRGDLSRMMAIHLEGAVAGAQRASAQMEARGGGAVLFVTSVFGLGGEANTLAYGAAKAALAHAVKVLAIEWARRDVRVNGIAPGLVDTDMTADLPAGVRDKLLRRIPMRRAAAPEEIAAAAVFLCSPAASYVTGHTLVVDGGERAR
jgi:NAD(P)-dependent dehydrogenase (short-subunit alcohol dehydrogenase family)